MHIPTQPLLFLDRIDGSRPLRTTEHQFLNIQFFAFTPNDIFPIIGSDGKLQISVNFSGFLRRESLIPIDHRKMVVDIMLSDKNSIRAALAAIQYRVNNGKNYVFSKPLSKALQRCSTNLPFSLFLTPFYAYIEIPDLMDDLDGSRILGTFVTIMPVPDIINHPIWMISIASITSANFSTRVFFHSRGGNEEDKNIEDVVDSVVHHENNIEHSSSSSFFIPSIKTYKEGITDRTILNAVAYIISNPDLKEEVNKFASKKSKVEGQKAVYTEKQFILAGRDFKFVKIQSVDKTWVDPFYRWQGCGEGRKLYKLVFVRGHERNYEK